MADSVDVTTYGDDKCFGKTAPSLELLDFVRGDKIDLQPGRVHVLYFFNTFYKGAYPVNEEFTKLFEKHGADVTFIAINNDAEKEKAEKFLTKEITDLNTNEKLRLELPYVAFDPAKATAKMYAAAADLSVMSCPHAFIIGKDGKIVWRQQFLQTYLVKHSNFEAQLLHAVAGEQLAMNGPKPKVDVEGEAAEADEMSLF